MGWITELRPDSPTAQTAGVVPRSIVLPGSLVGRQREITLSPERLAHLRRRRPRWFTFCLAHIPDVLATPDYIGQRPGRGDRRAEFVRLVGRPSRWLLVSVKFLDDRAEAWVNRAHPVSNSYLTRRRAAGTMCETRAGREDGKVAVAIPGNGDSGDPEVIAWHGSRYGGIRKGSPAAFPSPPTGSGARARWHAAHSFSSELQRHLFGQRVSGRRRPGTHRLSEPSGCE
jgi:hypothetical protein